MCSCVVVGGYEHYLFPGMELVVTSLDCGETRTYIQCVVV